MKLEKKGEKDLKYQLIKEGCEPSRAHANDAGMDLRAGIDITLAPQQIGTIPLGIKTEVPNGYCAILLPRSGIGSLGLGLRNTAGIIDSGYCGEWIAKVKNKSEDYKLDIKYGERIVQCIIVPIYLGEWYRGQVDTTERGDSGFGGSGKL